jgi:hypothetical protein
MQQIICEYFFSLFLSFLRMVEQNDIYKLYSYDKLMMRDLMLMTV